MSDRITVLACGACGNPLSGLSTDTAFLCGGCGAGWSIGIRGLRRIPVSIHTRGEKEILPLPFWRVEADMEVESRLTRRETHTVPMTRGRWFSPRLETGIRETGGFRETRRLVIPAFALNGLVDLAVGLSVPGGPLPEETPQAYPRLAGVFSRPEEIPALARAVCVGQEAAREDWLADLRLTLEVRAWSLMVLPGIVEGETVSLPGTGQGFYRRNMPDLERIRDHHRVPC